MELARAYEQSLVQESQLEEDDSDEEEITPAVRPELFNESQLPGSQGAGPDPTDQKPSSLRWDPATGRARLSLRAAVRNHTPNDDCRSFFYDENLRCFNFFKKRTLSSTEHWCLV